MPESKIVNTVPVPEEFICPLTKELITDPVVSRYGDSFERKAIFGWLEKGNSFCPVTGNPLRPSCLVSNESLKWKIRCWFHEQGKEAPEHEESEFKFSGFVAVVPDKFKCALTNEFMKEPVVSKWGHNFERDAILLYFDEHSDTCPVTGKPLSPQNLVTDASLKHDIHDWLKKNGDHGSELPALGPIDCISPIPQFSPKPAVVGIRGDLLIAAMRTQHSQKLILEDSSDEEDDPFSATSSAIDETRETPESLEHVL
jgi:hypothetical protein